LTKARQEKKCIGFFFVLLSSERFDKSKTMKFFAPDFKFKFLVFERDHICVRERLCRWGDKFWTCFLKVSGYLSESVENYYYIHARNLKLRTRSNSRDECNGFGHNCLIKQGDAHLKKTHSQPWHTLSSRQTAPEESRLVVSRPKLSEDADQCCSECTAAEGFSPTSLRAHWSGPELCG